MRKVKHLKDYEFQYNGDENPIETYISYRRRYRQVFDSVWIQQKRPVLALLKFLLEVLPLNGREWEKIEEIVKKNKYRWLRKEK